MPIFAHHQRRKYSPDCSQVNKNKKKLQDGSYLNHQEMLKNYKTIETKWPMIGKIVTNRIKDEFPQNRHKPQNITKPTEAKPLTVFYKLQNETYLETQNYKTNWL
jgi:hypothetical protein